uniref:NADH dehydrogenase subunit 2 n=1 Tax=Trichuris sp. LO613 TaxID=2856030 RepID=A0A8F5DRN7_9BILA|nr:NADH dehydrogenase subunit 2 [Trichuris sp. LO613]
MNITLWYSLYLTMLFLSMSMSNWLSMWTMLELSSWLMMMISLTSDFSYNMLFKMYVLFTLSSAILVFMWLMMSKKQQWILYILAFKMGIPPLHWWVTWIMKHMAWKTMWWFTTLHKVIPMMLSILLINSMLVLLWCVLSIIWSSFSFWHTSSYFMIFFYSSCVHSSWLWMTIYDLFSFMMYFSLYTMIMYHIFTNINKFSFWYMNNEMSILMIILLGIPTSNVFFMKLATISTIFSFTLIVSWTILLINILTIFPYTRMIWTLMTNKLFSLCHMPNNLNIISSIMICYYFTIWPVML